MNQAVSEQGRAHIRAVGRGGSLNLAGAGVAAALGVVLSVVVARQLSAADAGVYFSVTSFFLIMAAVARLGSPVGVVYFVARMRQLGQTDRIRALLRIGLAPVVVFSIGLGVALVVAAPWLVGLVAGGDEHGVPLIRALGGLLPVVALSDAVLAGSRGFGAMRPTVVLDRMARPILQVALTIGVLAAGLGVLAVTAAWALPYAAVVGVAAFGLVAMVRRCGPQVSVVPGLRAEYWRFTWPRAVTSVVQLCTQRLDVVLVGALSSLEQAAVYAVASRIVGLGQLTNSALGLAAQPRLAGLLAAGDRDGANSLYRTTTAWIILVNGPLYAAVAWFSPLLLGVFGAQYSAAWNVTVALCVAAFLGNGVGMVDVMLSMAGRTTWNLANGILALVVQVGFDLLLIPGHGAFGAAIGWGAAILTANLVPLTQLAVVDRLHPFGRSTALAAVVVTLTVVLPLALVVLAMGQTWLALAVGLTVAGALYLAACWRLRETLHVEALLDSLRRARAGS